MAAAEMARDLLVAGVEPALRDRVENLADRISNSARMAAHGEVSLEDLRTSTDLDPLGGRADFRLLMLDAAMPADPFARIDD